MILNLKPLLKQKGTLAKDLAEAVGMSTANMSYIMRGKVFPTENTLIKIAEYFDVPVYRLFMDSDTTNAVCPHCGKPIKIEVTIK